MTHYTAFAETRQIACGTLSEVALTLKQLYDQQVIYQGQFHVFADATGSVSDLDLHGSLAEVQARYLTAVAPEVPGEIASAPAQSVKSRGRPKLGVVSKEVTLLPRHWEWLAAQTGGASVALRKLIDEARKQQSDSGQARALQERSYKVMSALAADLPEYETAIRALFAHDREPFLQAMASWPEDYQHYFQKLAGLSQN